MRVPEGDGWGGALGRDRDHEIGLLALDLLPGARKSFARRAMGL